MDGTPPPPTGTVITVDRGDTSRREGELYLNRLRLQVSAACDAFLAIDTLNQALTNGTRPSHSGVDVDFFQNNPTSDLILTSASAFNNAIMTSSSREDDIGEGDSSSSSSSSGSSLCSSITATTVRTAIKKSKQSSKQDSVPIALTEILAVVPSNKCAAQVRRTPARSTSQLSTSSSSSSSSSMTRRQAGQTLSAASTAAARSRSASQHGSTAASDLSGRGRTRRGRSFRAPSTDGGGSGGSGASTCSVDSLAEASMAVEKVVCLDRGGEGRTPSWHASCAMQRHTATNGGTSRHSSVNRK